MINETNTSPESIVEVTMANAQAALIEASVERPVLALFWSQRSDVCIALKQLLEAIAQEKAGKFLLANVNTDELAGIASQLGVQSLPTLMVLQQGQPVDGLAGDQTEANVRALLDKFLPPQWQEDLSAAEKLLATDDINDQAKAIALLKDAWAESKQCSLAVLLADIYLNAGRLDDCEAQLKAVPIQDRQSAWLQVEAKLQLKREAGKAPEILALEQALAATPDDLAIVQQLAVALAQDKHHQEALELLFPVLKKNLGAADGAVRKTFQDILASLGKGDPLAVKFQRQLYALIY
ncbi:tetratricopeptide repeat protein [Simiduia curdlanivorans]|uniref:Tetratricopeptide repeat protein n=1 Tax=Simiduia curdlanivorans TaxID=1492769 RepID=A0ABV8V8T9_9GAMM|nr:tetratricopeptide repeat protein [Simiduia curdlanivorans]MDN3639758.1 tetratricopeptide repeat protein [Simiduia curdlanivorans]